MNFLSLGKTSSAIAIALLFYCEAQERQEPAWVGAFETANSEMHSGNLGGAEEQFNALWRANPRDPVLAVSIGGALDSAAHHEEAVAWYLRALAIQPNYEPALTDMALNYASRGQVEKAAPLLRQVLRANPENTRAAYNLGLVDLHLRRYAEAAEALRKAGEASHPPAPLSQIRLAEAVALFHAAKYAETVSLLAKEDDIPEGTRLLLLGSAQALSKDLPAAIATFQKAAQRFPENPQVYYRLALALLQGGRDRDARDVLDQGLKQAPSSPLLEYAMGVLADHSGDYEAAESWAQKSLALDKNQPDAWELLGSAFAARGLTGQGLDAYRQALRLGGSMDAGLAYAELLIRTGHASEAETELQSLTRTRHDDPRVERVFGRLYRSQKNYDEAESYFRRAIRLDPNDADAHFGLAETLRFTGHRAEAEKEYAIFMKQKNAARMVRLLEVVHQ